MKLRSSMAGLALVAARSAWRWQDAARSTRCAPRRRSRTATSCYAASDWRAAAAKYEEAIQLNPENAYSYFFLANSLDNLYRPTRVGEPENDALLTKAIEQLQAGG